MIAGFADLAAAGQDGGLRQYANRRYSIIQNDPDLQEIQDRVQEIEVF